MRANYKLPRIVKERMHTELYQYWKNKQDLEELQNEILESSSRPPDGQPRAGGISRPTEQKAIKLNELRTTRSILVAERKLSYIDEAFKKLAKEELDIVKVIFQKGYNQTRAQMECSISKDTYYNTMNKITYLTAIEFGEI